MLRTTFFVGMLVTATVGLSACNREADAGAAGPSHDLSDTHVSTQSQYARVLSVEPVRQTVNSPKQICHDEVVSHTEQPKDQHQIAGMAIGALAGGLLGSRVGNGKGRALAAVAGAVGGGYAGKKIEQGHQQNQVTQTSERRCETVNNTVTNIIGYDVRYEYNGVIRTMRMDHDPGDHVSVPRSVAVHPSSKQIGSS